MKISVAMCTFNGKKHIEHQIRSILDQTMKVDEIIICDDSSNDGTVDIINRIDSPIIKLYINDENLGYKKNFYKATQLCSGDIIFFSDQDDEWMLNKVEQTVRHFDEKKCLGVFSDGYLMDENSVEITISSLFTSSGFHEYIDKEVRNIDLFTILVLGNNTITGAAFAIKREALVDFSCSFLPHDYHLGIRIASQGKLSYLDKKLIRYRVHKNQTLGLKLETKEYYINNFKLYLSKMINESLYKHFIARKRFYYKIKRRNIIDDGTIGEKVYLDKVNYLNKYFWILMRGSIASLAIYTLYRFRDIAYKNIWLPLFFSSN